jgi:hypothetical protein
MGLRVFQSSIAPLPNLSPARQFRVDLLLNRWLGIGTFYLPLNFTGAATVKSAPFLGSPKPQRERR